MEQTDDLDLRAIQLAELDALKVLIKLCEENNIEYYALGGTLLGAVRHKGFIPWDDDIDIGVPRPQYEKLKELCREKLPAGYVAGHFSWDENVRNVFLIVENQRIEVKIKLSAKEVPGFAWVDVFPLDAMPNNATQRKVHGWKLYVLRMLYIVADFSKLVDLKRKRPMLQRLAIKMIMAFHMEDKLDREKRVLACEKALKKHLYDESDWLINLMGGYGLREMFHKSHYGGGTMYDFEDIQIRGPVDYDFVLKQLYGDYMKFPPEAERGKHSVELVSKNASWQETETP